MESKAAVMYSPSKTDELAESRPAQFERIDVEEPQAGEVLVEIAASSVCHTDVTMALGGAEEPLPLVLGHEGAGVVQSVGDDVESVAPGDHVVLGRIACGRCEHCLRGKSNLCVNRREYQLAGTLGNGNTRFTKDGEQLYHCHGVSSLTEYTVVTEEVAIPITDEIPLEEASLLGCGVFTGAGAVLNTANIDPGVTVAVFGLGGVGLSGLQAARIGGASNIIAVDIIPKKLEIAKRLGATHAVNSEEQDPVERINEITGGKGAEYTFDMVGHPKVTEQAVKAVATDGEAVIVGMPPEGTQDVGIDLRNVSLREKRIVGSFNGSYNLSLAIPQLAEYVADGRLSLDEMITDRRPMEELNEAMEEMVTGTGDIRQVIVP